MVYEYYVQIKFNCDYEEEPDIRRIGFFTYQRASEFHKVVTEFAWELGIDTIGSIEKA